MDAGTPYPTPLLVTDLLLVAEPRIAETLEPKIGMGVTIFRADGTGTPATVVAARSAVFPQPAFCTLEVVRAVRHGINVGYVPVSHRNMVENDGQRWDVFLLDGKWAGSVATFGANHQVVFGVRTSARLEHVASFITWMRGLHERTKYFHLSTCVCGQPSWQQPCPWCGFYPDHGRPAESKRETARAEGCADAARARLDAMNGAQGFFLAYRQGFRGVVAYKTAAEFRAWVDGLHTRWDARFNNVTVEDIRAYAALPRVY